MENILEKISSYNIFNYLLPGCLFVLFVKNFTAFDLSQDEILENLFLYYFIGLIISRLGSTLIEPVLKHTKFIKFCPYADFVSASKKDEHLNILSEVNNTYRTLISLILMVLITLGLNELYEAYSVLSNYLIFVSLIIVFFLFLFSYKKTNGLYK